MNTRAARSPWLMIAPLLGGARTTRTTHTARTTPAPRKVHPAHTTLIALVAFAGFVAVERFADAQLVLPDPQRPRIRQVEIVPESAPKAEPAIVALLALKADGTAAPAGDDVRPAWETCVALLPAQPRAAQIERGTGTLVLADGQRLRGTLQAGPEGARWKCKWLPPQALRAEGTRAIIVQGDDAPAATDSDIVLLANGDRLEGIVASLDAAGVTVERGSGAERTETSVPWERLRSVSFVGAGEPSPDVRVWLTDGSVLGGASGAWTTGDVLQVGPAPGSTVGPRVNIPRTAMLGVARRARVISALAELTPEVSEAADGAGLRYSLVPPQPGPGRWPLDAAPIEVEGPVKLRYAARPSPATLSMRATLDAGTRSTGAVELVVRASGRELHRAKLDAAHAHSDVRVELPVGTFEIELLAADGSAVGDVIRLERAVLIGRPPA